jgi:NTE family protein
MSLQIPNPIQWHNLVLQGGGVKTFVFHGALTALEEAGILANIKRVTGVSAGAMLAALLSFRLPIDETLAHYASVDMARIPQMISNDDMQPPWNSSHSTLQASLKGITQRTATMSRLVKQYGWYSSAYAYGWMRDVIAAQCDGNGDATFAEFQARGFRDLYVMAANVSKTRGELFSAETTPNAPVAAALLLSQSIPLFFEAIQFDGKEIGKGDYYADGGLVNAYPIELFDHPAYMEEGVVLSQGINWQTLGFNHYTPAALVRGDRPIQSLLTYMEGLAQMILNTQALRLALNPLNLRRTIQINNLGVSATDFSVQPVRGNTHYDQLFAQGYQTTQTFLDRYRSSSDAIPSRSA